jgi:hypothetical protein
VGTDVRTTDVDRLKFKVRGTKTAGGPQPFSELQFSLDYERKF